MDTSRIFGDLDMSTLIHRCQTQFHKCSSRIQYPLNPLGILVGSVTHFVFCYHASTAFTRKSTELWQRELNYEYLGTATPRGKIRRLGNEGTRQGFGDTLDLTKNMFWPILFFIDKGYGDYVKPMWIRCFEGI